MFKLCLLVSCLGIAVASPTTKSSLGIVGGQDIDISEAPNHVSLEYNGSYICGGSIIAKNIIITAAHCNAWFSSPSQYQVRAGSSFHEKGGELYTVEKFLKHPNYTFLALDYDIAVIWLSKPLQFSKNIAAIDLIATGEEVPDGAETISTGFGAINEDGDLPSKLQMVKVPKVNDEVCKKAYTDPFTVTPNMICAGKGGKAAYSGDSGGPLVYQNKLVGVASWVLGCAKPNYPTVYARISALRPWLESVIQKIETYTSK